MSGVTWDLVQHKAKAVSQLTNGNLTILEAVQPSTKPRESMAGFSAIGRVNQVYCQVKVVARTTFAVSFSYYKHSCPDTSREVEAHAQEVLNSCLAAPDA